MGCVSCFLFWFILAIISAGVSLKIYIKLTKKRNGSYTCLVGKTAIITGANTGIGYTTALDFAMRGARVILACRSEERGEEAQNKIIKATGNENVAVKLLDLESLDAVRQFAKNINETEKRIDILVNNAAIAYGDNYTTKDGLQVSLATNHFSPFLLTHLLIDKLKSSAPSRIVNVSSLAAKSLSSKFDADDLNKYLGGSKIMAQSFIYGNTKLCNVLFTTELAKKLDDSGVTVNCLHPGTIKTDILRSTDGIYGLVFGIFAKLFFMTPEEGAQTTIYVSVSKDIENVSGELFDNCRRIDLYDVARDPSLAKKVWEKSEQFVKLKNEEKL